MSFASLTCSLASMGLDRNSRDISVRIPKEGAKLAGIVPYDEKCADRTTSKLSNSAGMEIITPLGNLRFSCTGLPLEPYARTGVNSSSSGRFCLANHMLMLVEPILILRGCTSKGNGFPSRNATAWANLGYG